MLARLPVIVWRLLVTSFRDIGNGLANVTHISPRRRLLTDDEMFRLVLAVVWLALMAWIWWP